MFLFPEFVSKQLTKLAAVRSGESLLPRLLAEEHNVNAPALSIYLFIQFKQLTNRYSVMRQGQTSRWFPNEVRSTAVKSLLTCIFFVITWLTEATSEVCSSIFSALPCLLQLVTSLHQLHC